MKKLVFDTLDYVNMLEKGGVSNAETHAIALAKALAQSIYTKIEVNNMFDAAIKRFDENSQKMREEFKSQIHRLEIEMRSIESKLEKKIVETNNETVRRLTLNLSIVMTLLTVAASVLHFTFR